MVQIKEKHLYLSYPSGLLWPALALPRTSFWVSKQNCLHVNSIKSHLYYRGQLTMRTVLLIPVKCTQFTVRPLQRSTKCSPELFLWGPMVEISCKEFFFSPRLRVIYRVFHLYKFPGVQELIIDRVFSFREFISSFIRFSFLEGGGLQTQEGSPLNAFATEGKYTNFHLYGFSDT